MILTDFFSASDGTRAAQVLRKLARHDISRWALTGGFATEFHMGRVGFATVPRVLNDIDFVADSFGDIPRTLAEDFLFRHIHPFDPPAKTILQCVDPEAAVRIDLFRAYGGFMRRALPIETSFGRLRVVSQEDLAARTARLTWDLAGSVPIPAKYARDCLRFFETTELERVETVWPEHRKPGFPATFAETTQRLRTLINTRIDLLITPEYSKEINEKCERCHDTSAFHLADPNVVFGLLGYV